MLAVVGEGGVAELVPPTGSIQRSSQNRGTPRPGASRGGERPFRRRLGAVRETIRTMRLLGGSLLGLLLLVAPAGAQDADRLELKALVGTSGFLDEVIDYYPIVGAAARIGMSPMFAIEPEFTYFRASSTHQDYAFQTAAIWQLRRSSGIQFYLIAAGGVRHRRFRFPGGPSGEVFLERVHGRRRRRGAGWPRSPLLAQPGGPARVGAPRASDRRCRLRIPMNSLARRRLPVR